MSAVTTRTREYTAPEPALMVAFELGEKDWKLAFSTGLETPARHRTVPARDRGRVMHEMEAMKRRLQLPEDAPVLSCYEAGREGFWLHRFLVSEGIRNRVVDSTSIEVNRRARRAKTDRLDAQKLLTMLLRHRLGEKQVFSIVRVPSVTEEDARSLHREYRTLLKERARSVNRIKGLLANHGLRPLRIDGGFLLWLERVQLWDRSSLPGGARARIEREYARWQFVHRQVLDLDQQRREAIRSAEGPVPDRIRQLHGLKGIGAGSAWTYVLEFFAWRRFRNGKEVGALAGLAPTPHQSGEESKERGISKAGNRYVRAMAIEIAWGWLRHQPQSELTRWYQRRFARGGPRARKIGIVAVARKLLIALWRYVEFGELPKGAELKA